MDRSRPQWAAIFRQLVVHGLLEVDVEGHGGLSLTASSKAVLSGNAKVLFREELSVPKKEKSRASRQRKKGAELGAAAPTLFEALRQKRLSLAKEKNVPPYVIFHDATLLEIAARKPKSVEELRGISGIGETKLARYGEAMVEVVKAVGE